MTQITRRLFCTAWLLVPALARADDVKPGGVAASAAWARATTAGQRSGGAWLRIHNPGGADRLVGASTAAAQGVELHAMTMEGDVMRMRQLDAIELPAGQTVELRPGGLHLMLMGLKAPLREGETFQVELKFEKAGSMTVPVAVRAAGAGAMPHDMQKH